MTRLVISNFLSIREADLTMRPLTILIGPQAQGKSVIAKVQHFFQWLVQMALVDVVSGEVSVAQLRRTAVERFVELFPRYTWTDIAFKIQFTDSEFSIAVSRSGSRKNAALQVEFSRQLTQSILELAGSLKPRIREAIGKSPHAPESYLRRRELTSFYRDKELIKVHLAYPLFIPASRSFFANVEKNIFSLISSKFELDPLMAEFGAALERTRTLMHMARTRPALTPKELTRVTEWSDIIHGDYVFDGKDEYVQTGKRMVRLANSSSGQQESVPLLLMMKNSGTVARDPASGVSFSIEEPEAHLFPSAQKAIALLLAQELNENVYNRVLVTTHSPYILTAFNNLILAGMVLEQDPNSVDAVREVVPRGCAISPSAVSAYKVLDGTTKTIMDASTNLINSYLIDEISAEFGNDFDRLLALKH